jgi:uncharacterized protein
MFILGVVLTMGIGAALGAIGSGGSILALPVLVYVLDIPPKDAIPISLVLVGTASVGATLLRWRDGDVDPKALVLLASTGAAGAYIGSAATHMVSSFVLMMLFASTLLVVAVLMVTNALSDLKASHCQIPRCLAAGALVGLLTGFLGVGGGFLLVPALILFAGLELRRALGTSVGVISANALAGIAGQLRFMNIDWKLAGVLVAATLAGMVFGVTVGNRLPDRVLRRALAFVMIAVALGVIAAQFTSRFRTT